MCHSRAINPLWFFCPLDHLSPGAESSGIGGHSLQVDMGTLRGIVDRDGDGATPNLGPGDDIEAYLERRKKLFAAADSVNDATSFKKTNNAIFDTCAGLFLNPFPDARGMAAIMQGLACCPDNAPLGASALAAFTGYSVYSLVTGFPQALAGAIGCILGGNIGAFFR